jgi:V/A-type H+/Na+-transporting ATPase subunit D
MKTRRTKGELKKQRDNVRRFRRFLPTLQLKKQQLQLEIIQTLALREKQQNLFNVTMENIKTWAGLLSDSSVSLKDILSVEHVVTKKRNIAGIDVPVFDHVVFTIAEYDLFLTPWWVDTAIDCFKELFSLREHLCILDTAIDILHHELRIATQRVNLFEKVKIPEAEEAIRLIKIYIGDQLANAIGRSKIAKRKITISERGTVLI